MTGLSHGKLLDLLLCPGVKSKPLDGTGRRPLVRNRHLIGEHPKPAIGDQLKTTQCAIPLLEVDAAGDRLNAALILLEGQDRNSARKPSCSKC